MGPAWILSVAVLGAPGPKDGAGPKDVTGDWVVVEQVIDGKAVKVDGDVYRFEPDGTLVFRLGGKDRNQPRSRYAADPAAKPPTIDLYVDAKPDSPVSRGLYKVDGDTLTIAVGELNAERPKELASRPGSKVSLMTLRKVKPQD